MIDGTSVTLELTELLKTRTTQNDQNYLRIYIFDKKNIFSISQSATQFTTT